MNKHVNAVAVIRLGLAVLGVMLVVTVYFGARWLITFPEVREEKMAESVIITVSNAAVVFVSAGSVLNLIAGVGLLAYQGWARVLTMILSILDLFNIPVGTALALYSLWVLMQDTVIERFGGQPSAIPAPEKLARQT